MGTAARQQDMDATVAIVGAGPSGTATALHLAQLGVPGVVLLDRQDFPRHKTCGSGLSPKGIKVLEELGVWSEVASIAYPIIGLRLVTPGGKDVYLSGGEKSQAAICLRHDLDHTMLRQALGLGVRFVPHFQAMQPIVEGGRWAGVVGRDGRRVRARYTVVANGAHSKLALDERPKRVIRTIMGWWDNVPFRDNHLEMIFDRMVEPYYGWLFPESPTRVNIGITYEDSGQNARELFARFLDKYYAARLTGATKLRPFKGHPIHYTYRLGRMHAPGRVVTGEAARLTHPATGEGIYQGMRSGMLCARALRDVVLRGVSPDRAFGRYTWQCRREFLPSFWAGGLFRRLVRTPILDWVASLAGSSTVKLLSARMLASL